MTLFDDELTPEVKKLIQDNAPLVNKHLYDWIQAEKKITGGIAGDVLRYLALAKRRKNPAQQPIKVTLSRKNAIERLVREKVTKEQFKKVIDYVVHSWWDTDSRKYLTPETLFKSVNFNRYLEEAIQEGQIKGGKKDEITRMGQN